MRAQHALYTLIAAFFVGVVGATAFYQWAKPSPQELAQREVDRLIGGDLCERMQADLERYKDAPLAFQRTTLKALLGEARAVAQATSTQSGGDVRFDTESPALVSGCVADAKRWTKIPSRFPAEVANEEQWVRSQPDASWWTRLRGGPDGPPHVAENPPASDARPNAPPHATTVRERVALVIGNSDYRSAPKLRNPSNDASEMAAFLQEAGFEVRLVKDQELSPMKNAVEEFLSDLHRYRVALVYYSGHGVEFRGRNYLLPIDAALQKEDEIPLYGVDATLLAEKLRAANLSTAILVIDACRSVPIFSKFRDSGGLGLGAMQSPAGTVIAFSAAPGQVASDGNGKNSPYTEALLKQLRVPDRKIEDVLKETGRMVQKATQDRQIPWYSSSLRDDFYFIQSRPAVTSN